MIRTPRSAHPESRVPVYVAIVSGALLHLALPPQIAPGPSWLPVAIVVPLLLPHVLARDAGKNRLARRVGSFAMASLTLFLLVALTTLIGRLLSRPSSHAEATMILRAAVPLWLANVLVFALWYWRLDAGGPHIRDSGHHFGHGFVFPQMTMDEAQLAHYGQKDWRPKFVDYLFLSFNTSTALSPTDTAVVAGWAKGLTMLQSMVSILLLVVVAARAVNIL